jgi:predicted nucleic acid-binding protein
MILVDANLLLYAYNTDAPEHKAAKKWLEDTLALPSPFGFLDNNHSVYTHQHKSASVS